MFLFSKKLLPNLLLFIGEISVLPKVPTDESGELGKISTPEEEFTAPVFHKVRSFESSSVVAPWALISSSTSINERPLDFALLIYEVSSVSDENLATDFIVSTSWEKIWKPKKRKHILKKFFIIFFFYKYNI